MVLALVSTLAGLGATLLTLVVLVLAAPNRTAAESTTLATLGWVSAIAGALGLGGAVYAAVTGRTGLAAWIGGGPVLVCALILVALAQSG